MGLNMYEAIYFISPYIILIFIPYLCEKSINEYLIEYCVINKSFLFKRLKYIILYRCIIYLIIYIISPFLILFIGCFFLFDFSILKMNAGPSGSSGGSGSYGGSGSAGQGGGPEPPRGPRTVKFGRSIPGQRVRDVTPEDDNIPLSSDSDSSDEESVYREERIDPKLKESLVTKLENQITFNDFMNKHHGRSRIPEAYKHLKQQPYGKPFKSEYITSGNYQEEYRLTKRERELLYHIVKDNQKNTGALAYFERNAIDRDDLFCLKNPSPRFRSVASLHPITGKPYGVAKDADKALVELVKSADKYYTKR